MSATLQSLETAPVPSRRAFLRRCIAGVVVVPAWAASEASASSGGGCPDLCGHWCGSWRSFCTGHHGKLNGQLWQDGCGDYRARFTGTFWKVFPVIHPTTLNVTGCSNGTVSFRGSQNLAGLGEFCYSGCATCCNFSFRYTSRKDRGIFQMSR